MPADERFADDGGMRAIAGVRLADIAAARDSDAERVEVSGRHVAQERCGRRLACDRLAGHAHRKDTGAEHERRRGHVGRAGDAGERADLVEHAMVKGLPRRRGRVLRNRQRGPQHDDIVSFEAGIDRLHGPQRAHQQAGGHEQDDRRHDLGDDERGPQPLFASASRTRAFAQPLRVGVAADPQHRCDAEHQAGRSRHQRREHQHADVDRRRVGDRQRVGHESRQQRHGGRRDRDAEQAAGACEHHALGQQLTHETLAARAHRGAHGELAAPLQRAREEQVREVGARDEQHAAGRAAQRIEEQA